MLLSLLMELYHAVSSPRATRSPSTKSPLSSIMPHYSVSLSLLVGGCQYYGSEVNLSFHLYSCPKAASGPHTSSPLGGFRGWRSLPGGSSSLLQWHRLGLIQLVLLLDVCLVEYLCPWFLVEFCNLRCMIFISYWFNYVRMLLRKQTSVVFNMFYILNTIFSRISLP